MKDKTILSDSRESAPANCMPMTFVFPVNKIPLVLSKMPKAIKLQKPQIPCVDIESIGSSISNFLKVLLQNSCKMEPKAPMIRAAQD